MNTLLRYLVFVNCLFANTHTPWWICIWYCMSSEPWVSIFNIDFKQKKEKSEKMTTYENISLDKIDPMKWVKIIPVFLTTCYMPSGNDHGNWKMTEPLHGVHVFSFWLVLLRMIEWESNKESIQFEWRFIFIPIINLTVTLSNIE